MIINSIILIFFTVGAGLTAFYFGKKKLSFYKPALTFGGAYLFSITITHILPQVYYLKKEASLTLGIFILGGFFLQLLLENLSHGIEHGHRHAFDIESKPFHPTAIALMVGLCIHSILEGTLIGHPYTIYHHHNHGDGSVLIGILLHKMPAAFALTLVIWESIKNMKIAIIYLVIFSIMSPIGMIAEYFMGKMELIAPENMSYIYALVSGSFLQISTTIFYETSPEHKINPTRFGIAIAGAALAILTEMIF
ncbi:ZIP family metal transporter [Marinigracilibium pacificum]|uniref:ZIP family metal transporter n=1 Tax=Marinigracilibium pacificum TaxID=2729599 RepID=A0A848J2L2_9BACT|nr:ZIP family metal transporter [Marinigracilibium pacificum]NMM49745.1 ZIP family metal transporter [Marinigracilibium pacificum]